MSSVYSLARSRRRWAFFFLAVGPAPVPAPAPAPESTGSGPAPAAGSSDAGPRPALAPAGPPPTAPAPGAAASPGHGGQGGSGRRMTEWSSPMAEGRIGSPTWSKSPASSCGICLLIKGPSDTPASGARAIAQVLAIEPALAAGNRAGTRGCCMSGTSGGSGRTCCCMGNRAGAKAGPLAREYEAIKPALAAA